MLLKFPQVEDQYNLYLDPLDTFLQRLDSAERSLSIVDKSEVRFKNEILREDSKEIPAGRFTYIIEDVGFDCYLRVKKSDILYVFLSGYTSKKQPIFNRWSWNCTDSVLCIADPMITTYNIGLGWYYGDNEKDYRELISKIICKIASMLGISKNHIIIYGSSGGGNAAVYISGYISGSISVSINPQIDIKSLKQRYIEFVEKTNLNIDDKNLKYRNDMVKSIQSSASSKHLFIVNCQSLADLKSYYNLCNNLDYIPQYGLSNKDNVISWIYSASPIRNKNVNRFSTHSAQETLEIYSCIDGIIKYILAGESLSLIRPLILVINGLWRSIFEKQNQIDIYNIKLDADKGDIECKMCLATLYYQGQFVKKDILKATEYVKEIIAQNPDYSDPMISTILVESESPEDRRFAYEYCLKNQKLSYNYRLQLSKMYEKGRGVRKNEDKAQYWKNLVE